VDRRELCKAAGVALAGAGPTTGCLHVEDDGLGSLYPDYSGWLYDPEHLDTDRRPAGIRRYVNPVNIPGGMVTEGTSEVLGYKRDDIAELLRYGYGTRRLVSYVPGTEGAAALDAFPERDAFEGVERVDELHGFDVYTEESLGGFALNTEESTVVVGPPGFCRTVLGTREGELESRPRTDADLAEALTNVFRGEYDLIARRRYTERARELGVTDAPAPEVRVTTQHVRGGEDGVVRLKQVDVFEDSGSAEVDEHFEDRDAVIDDLGRTYMYREVNESLRAPHWTARSAEGGRNGTER